VEKGESLARLRFALGLKPPTDPRRAFILGEGVAIHLDPTKWAHLVVEALALQMGSLPENGPLRANDFGFRLGIRSLSANGQQGDEREGDQSIH
jgi:hypothetical protein